MKNLVFFAAFLFVWALASYRFGRLCCYRFGKRFGSGRFYRSGLCRSNGIRYYNGDNVAIRGKYKERRLLFVNASLCIWSLIFDFAYRSRLGVECYLCSPFFGVGEHRRVQCVFYAELGYLEVSVEKFFPVQL